MSCIPVANYNEYTGNGSTTSYSFTFQYSNTDEIKVRMGAYPNWTDLATTEYSVNAGNPTQVDFNSAPSGLFRIYRCTNNSSLPATFQAGSAIRAADLNNNFETMLFVVQDSNIRSTEAQTTGDTAYTNANTAITTANSAVTTANSAVTTANSAVTTANSAVATANAAAAAVADAVLYQPVANVAGIPSSPSNNDYVEVQNSTGIESFSPLSGLPSGFVGDSGLTVRIKYVTNTWVWQSYFANDPNDRFIKKSGDTFTGLVTLAGAPTQNLHAATKQYVDTTVSDASDLKGGGTDQIFLEQPQTVTTSYTITANRNALVAGPLAFNSGATVTVPSSSNLVII